jgi:hypothetical protein
MQRRLAVATLALSWTLGCGGTPPVAEAPPVPPPPPPPPAAMAPPAAAPAPTPAPAPQAETKAAPQPVVKYTGFATPESVLWDEQGDRYLVSNINGKPDGADNNGFISVLSPDGQVTTRKWIEGGKNKVTLNAPKGTAIVKGVLYVADISSVRMFDAKSGAPKGEIKIAGATFLNDVAAAPSGKVYVSDTGVKVGEKGFEPTGTDAVYVIERGKAKPVAKSTDLGRPNGLCATDMGLWVVTMGSGEMYRLDDKGARQDVVKLPKGSLDGINMIGPNTAIVSSWEGSAVFKGEVGGKFDVVLADQKTPADIGYDAKRKRVLIPHFMGDTVEAYAIE